VLINFIMFSAGAAAAGPVRLGVHGGLSIPDIRGSETDIFSRGFTSRRGPFFGIFADFGLIPRFSLVAELTSSAHATLVLRTGRRSASREFVISRFLDLRETLSTLRPGAGPGRFRTRNRSLFLTPLIRPAHYKPFIAALAGVTGCRIFKEESSGLPAWARFPGLSDIGPDAVGCRVSRELS
jgi:hypothetical protein